MGMLYHDREARDREAREPEKAKEKSQPVDPELVFSTAARLRPNWVDRNLHRDCAGTGARLPWDFHTGTVLASRMRQSTTTPGQTNCAHIRGPTRRAACERNKERARARRRARANLTRAAAAGAPSLSGA
eukprot:gene21651-49975_t